MQPLLVRILSQHDLTIFACGALMSWLGAYATSVLGRQAAQSPLRNSRLRWMLLAILAATFAIWADSFLAMLGMRLAVPPAFEPLAMIASFVVGAVLVTLGAQVTIAGRTLRAPIIGGAITGLSISAMHYVGMSGFRVAGTIQWDFVAVAVSVAIGIVFSVAAAVLWLRDRSRTPQLAIALFTIAICGDHLVAMSAAIVFYDPQVVLPEAMIGDSYLERIVGVIALLILALTLTARSMNRKSRLRREAERQQLQQLAEVAVEGLVICEGTRIVWINRSLEGMLPGTREQYIGTSIELLLGAASYRALSHDREIDAQLKTGDPTTASTSAVFVPVRVITRAIHMAGRPHVVVAIRDQRERLHTEAAMRRMANYDALTGLANRTRFNAMLRQMFASPSSPAGGFALLSLDLDRFKSVNDTCGHAAGDAVLVEVGARLKSLVREDDLVARLGGDEFAILAATGRDASAISALADRAIETIRRPFVTDGRVHEIGVSIGIAFATRDGGDAESLIRSADLALHRAKSDGRGIHRLFEEAMKTSVQERHVLEQALRQAVAQSEFTLHFQPQVDARTGAFNGAEALVRWRHPVRGLVGPSDFIPIAEETNLIAPIGEWVLRTACYEAARWPDHLVVAVNLSPVQFRDPELVTLVASALVWSGLPGRRLELEITESVLIDDPTRVKAVLDELKGLGIRLSLDDFGTGYSSLGLLQRFPFDKIKVDRSFIARAPDDAGSAAIVRAVVALGAGLGMQTSAEGVETDAQLHFANAAGCDQIQGFLFGRPVPVESLPEAFRVVGDAAHRERTRVPLGVAA